MKKNTRIILTVVFGIWFIIMFAMRGGVQDGYKIGVQNASISDTSQSTQDEDKLSAEKK